MRKSGQPILNNEPRIQPLLPPPQPLLWSVTMHQDFCSSLLPGPPSSPQVCFPLCNQMKPGSKVISLLCSKSALLPQQMPNFTGNHITRMTPLPLHSVPKRKICALFPACGHPTKHLHMLVGVPEIIFYTFSHWWQKEQFLQKTLCPGLRMSLDDFSQVPRPKGWGNGRRRVLGHHNLRFYE